MQTGQSATTAAGQLTLALERCRGGDSWQSSGNKRASGRTMPRKQEERKEREEQGATETESVTALSKNDHN